MVYIFLIILVGIIMLMSKASALPDVLRIVRSMTINAPPEKIYPLIDDLTAHGAWSPLENDPAIKKTFSGPVRGPGAAMAWSGGQKAGRLVITRVVPDARVVMKLDMVRPVALHGVVVVRLARVAGNPAADPPVPPATVVTLAMESPQTLASKMTGIVLNSEKTISAGFITGLSRLKDIAERP